MPEIPICWSLDRNKLWSALLKAFLKSNWTISHGVRLSRLVLSAWVKSARADSQLLLGGNRIGGGCIVWQTMEVMEIGQYEWMLDLRGHRVPF